MIPHEDGELDVTAGEDAEQTSKVDNTTTTQAEDKVSETKYAKRLKSMKVRYCETEDINCMQCVL